MSTIRGKFIGGKVEFETPPDWPEGADVRVNTSDANEYVGVGMREEDWPTTPEGIDALIARMDAIEPFLSPEDEEAWRKSLAEQKAFELANWDKRNKMISERFQ